MNLHDLPECHLPKKQHEKRQQAHIFQGALLEKSVRNWDFGVTHNTVITKRPVWNEPFVPMADMYKDMPFGAVNTVEKAGCICFVTYYFALDFMPMCAFTFEDWVKEVVYKGYRMWKFRDYPGAFASRKIDVQEVKKRFGDKVDLTGCYIEEDLIAKLGPVEGIGGSMYLLDNLITILSEKEDIRPVEDTRITSVRGIFDNLEAEMYVPLRVNNSIYHNDQMRTGGHYVILYGVKKETALVWDSSIGYVELPFKTLMEAAVADKNLIAVWDIY